MLTLGPQLEKFEVDFCKYTKSKYAVAVSNCTAALHLSLKALGIKIVRDNDVLVPQELQKGAIFNNKNTLKQLGFKWNSELKRWEKTA